MVSDQIRVGGLSVRGQPHELVFAGVDPEPRVGREGGVEEPQRVRESQLVRQRDPVRVSDAVAGRGPFSDTVQCQNRGVLKRRGEERTGGVRLVVLGEGDALAIGAPESAPDLPGQVQLLREPLRHCVHERPEAARRVGQVGLEQALELQERLVVEPHIVEVRRLDARLGETAGDGVGREPGIVLRAREALLLRRRDDTAIDEECRRRVVIERGDAEDGDHVVGDTVRSVPPEWPVRNDGGIRPAMHPGWRCCSSREYCPMCSVVARPRCLASPA